MTNRLHAMTPVDGWGDVTAVDMGPPIASITFTRNGGTVWVRYAMVADSAGIVIYTTWDDMSLSVDGWSRGIDHDAYVLAMGTATDMANAAT